MNRVALDLLLSRLICFSAVFTLISTQTTARISHMNTHLIFCVLMLAELFTTTALHTLTWTPDSVCSSAVCPPKTSKHLAQETTETNSSMCILYPVKVKRRR